MRHTIHAVVLALTCGTALAGPREEALAVVDRWTAAFAAADVEAIASLYARDATFMGTSSTSVVTSPAAIRDYFERALLTDRPRTATLGEPVVTVLSPTAAVVAATDTMTRVRAGMTLTTHGRLTFLVAQRGTEWRIVHFHRSAMPER